MTDQATLRNIRKAIRHDPWTKPESFKLRRALVVEADSVLNPPTCDIQLGGSEIVVEGVPVFTHYCPTPGDVVWVASMGTDLLVLGVHQRSPWEQYFPIWTSASAPLPVLNNGTLDGRFRIRDGQLFCRMRLTVGSTTTFGSGNWRFDYPIGVALDQSMGAGENPVGIAIALDSSTGNRYRGICRLQSANNTGCGILFGEATSNLCAPAVPFTWAAGDVLEMFINGAEMV